MGNRIVLGPKRVQSKRDAVRQAASRDADADSCGSTDKVRYRTAVLCLKGTKEYARLPNAVYPVVWGSRFRSCSMNWVLIVLQVAVLLTLLFAYGRR